jgi:hypothetical protein
MPNSTPHPDARMTAMLRNAYRGAHRWAWTLDGMSELPRYTSAGIGMARWYFRLGGASLLVAGIAVWLATGLENAIGVGILVLLGLASFAYSFVHPGDRVAHAAREHFDTLNGD